MKPNYTKLRHLLVDKNMKKVDLARAVNLSPATSVKLSHNQWVSLEVIGRICKALDCEVGDVVSFDYEEDDDHE